ncbi:MAG: Type 3 secretion system secretin [Chlamydiales bacterium]|nr:Type 3 secretion system secretin [Chlamydiales bacterium]
MVYKQTVRIAFSLGIFLVGAIACGDERLGDDTLLRELAETYLEHPTIITRGNSQILPNEESEFALSNERDDNSSTNEDYYFKLPSSMKTGPSIPAEKTLELEDQIETEPHLFDYQKPKTLLEASEQEGLYPQPACPPEQEGYTVNFEDISVIQLIQFISKISGTNFIFDSQDLQFNITIVSEDETSVADLSASLLQVLKMYGLSVVEEGNNVLIYKNQEMSRVSTVITDANVNLACDTAMITRVFRLYNVDVQKIAVIVQKLVSSEANVEASTETQHIIVTDITANVNRIADLLAALDVPNITIDVAEYQVKSEYPDALAEYARQILEPFSTGGGLTLTAEAGTHKIFIVGSPFLIKKALQILSSLDVPEITDITQPIPLIASADVRQNQLYMYKLKYQDGHEIAMAMQEIGDNLLNTGVANEEFVNTINAIQWIQVNNSIIVTGTEAVIKKVVELLDDLDQPPKQVYVEVLIIDTTLTNSLDFGVQWIALGDEQDKLAYASGLLSDPPPNLQGTANTSPGARRVAANPAANPPAIPNAGRDVPLPTPSELNGQITSNFTSSFGFGIIGNILRHNGQSFLTLGALVTALDEEQETKVVLNPRVMVEDNQPATFFVGQNIPYQTTSTVVQQTGSVTQNLQYEDIGVELRVTPTIAPNNIVTLDIVQSVAELATLIGNLTPTTDKRLVTTRVHVPDGTFLVMSGHVRDRCDYIRSGIPCLGTLPLIGPTFSRTIEQRSKRNLIFFVRPRVITSIQEGLDFTNQEGYEYNWETDPCSILDCQVEQAPECETYPAFDPSCCYEEYIILPPECCAD